MNLYSDDPRYDIEHNCVIFNAVHGLELHKTRTTEWPETRFWPFPTWPVDWFEAQLDALSPMTIYWRGKLWQPDRHAHETDLGSIPPPVRALYPHTLSPAAFYTHDRAFAEGGLYAVECPVGPFDSVLPDFYVSAIGPMEYQRMSWREAQDLLHAMLSADCVRRDRVRAICAATALFSRSIWARRRTSATSL